MKRDKMIRHNYCFVKTRIKSAASRHLQPTFHPERTGLNGPSIMCINQLVPAGPIPQRTILDESSAGISLRSEVSRSWSILSNPLNTQNMMVY
jgi:hypothetical protein